LFANFQLMSQPQNNRQLGEKSLDAATIFAQLSAFKTQDVPWQSGRAFAYVYEPPAETKAVVAQAIGLYLSENALDPTSFPSLLKLENDVVSMAINLLNGDSDTVGNFTSGGTESIILALKTARDYNRAHRPHIQKPQVIICETAHAAFHKAGHYLGLEIVVVPMNSNDFTMDIAAAAAAINENTILLVGSAPNYSHGVIDDIEALAALAQKNGLLCHVDACVGGFYLPFVNLLGGRLPAFDFSVAGVTSISCDLHKYAYTVKGASLVLHRNAELRKFQIYTCSSWTGYTIINPTVLSSKSGATLAGAWAAMHHLGREGYTRLCSITQAATAQFIAGANAIEGLEVMGTPVMNLVAVRATTPAVSVFSVADALKKKGWHIQVQLASPRSPEALHLNINYANAPWVAELLVDLAAVVADLLAQNEPLPQFEPSFFAELLQAAGGFDQAAASLGLGAGSDLPEDFAAINNILNQLPTEARTMMLTEFANRLFVAR
jgi:glutamate/tyrosine decarboxylase-like PLP-dependent enzyme